MHIAIDARIINSTTGRYVERLVTHLQAIDTKNRYTVIVPSKDKNYWRPTAKNFTVVTADFDNYSLAEQVGFNQFLTNLGADLVHFCMPQQPIAYKGKKVTTFHDLTLVRTYNSDKNWLVFHAKQLVGRFVFKNVARTSHHIITPSQFTKQDLVRFARIPDQKVTVTYEASDARSGGSKPFKLPYTRYILYVGQQSDYKNIRRLAEVHQRLLADFPDLGLVLVGNKNASAIKNESIFANKNFKNILFTGFVDDDQLNWLYAHATSYVFPSLMEGFGLPGLEAMAHGTPVISSNATCLPEVYGDAAYYFNPKDSQDMYRAIKTVLTDQQLRLDLTKRGYQQVKKYSWEKMARQTYRVYMDVLGGK